MREMKNSGIDWINIVPKNWDTIRLKSILVERNEKNNPIKTTNLLSLSIERGVFPYSEKTGGGNKAKENFQDYKLTHVNDIVLNSMNVVVGAVGISKYYGCVSPVYYTLYSRNNELYNINYYNYIFQSEVFQKSLWGLGNGIVVKESDNGKLNTIRMRIPLEKLNGVILPVPPIKEQEKIVTFLDEKIGEIDNAISKTKETIEDYKKLKQTVITELFKKGIQNEISKDPGLKYIKQIPQSWHTQSLKSFSTLISKGTTPNDMETNFSDIYNIRYLKSENIVQNELINKPEFYITEEVHNGELKRSKLFEDDILFVIAGASIGKTAIVKSDFLPANTNQAVCFIRLKKKYNSIKKYIWYYFQTDYISAYINLFSVQAAQPNISMENLGNIKIPCPKEIVDCEKIVLFLDKKCDSIDSLIKNKEKIVEELEKYKKSVIYEYVTGKKEVK